MSSAATMLREITEQIERYSNHISTFPQVLRTASPPTIDDDYDTDDYDDDDDEDYDDDEDHDDDEDYDDDYEDNGEDVGSAFPAHIDSYGRHDTSRTLLPQAIDDEDEDVIGAIPRSHHMG